MKYSIMDCQTIFKTTIYKHSNPILVFEVVESSTFVVPQSVMHGDQQRSPFVSIIKKVGLIFNEGKKYYLWCARWRRRNNVNFG